MSLSRVAAAIVFAGVLAVAVLVFIDFHATNEDLRDTLEFSAALVGGAGVVFGVFYGFLIGAEQRAQLRRRRALELIDQLNKHELVRLRFGLENAIDLWEPGADPPDELKADLSFYLGLLEDLALAIRIHDADEVVLYQSLSFAVPRSYEVCKRFVDFTRQDLNDGTIFEELEALAQSWSAGKCYRSGKRMRNRIDGKPISKATV